jgi:predicted extracellular nuclease
MSQTRDILYVQGAPVNGCQDTLHLFVNHWSSRYGGYAATMEKRERAGDILRKKVDSIFGSNPQARMLIMGDFNDYPDDKSITQHLKATLNMSDTALNKNCLLNLMYPYMNKNNIGTHKYQQHWGILDQIIVSQALFNAKIGLRTKNAAHIFNADFLLEKDENNMGVKPFRTYLGMKYVGGFSDHLPIFVDLFCE